MNELLPPSYGLFAHEAGKIELANPDIANHDIRSSITIIQNGLVDIFEYLSDEEFDQLYAALKINLDSSSEDISLVIADKIAAIQTIVQGIQNRDESIAIPSQVRFALNPEHHAFLYHLHDLWNNPNNIHTIESLRRCRVDLPLLLEAFGVQYDDSCAEVEVSGVIAGMTLSNARNASKYALKGTMPTARLIMDNGDYQLCIANQSINPHVLPDQAYPHERPIALGNRGSAAMATHVLGKGTGAYAMKVLGILHNAQSHIWETGAATIDDMMVYEYESRISFPSYARGSA